MFWTVLAVGLGAHGWWLGSWMEVGFGILAGVIGVRGAVMAWDKPSAFMNCVATLVAFGFLIALMIAYDRARTRGPEPVAKAEPAPQYPDSYINKREGWDYLDDVTPVDFAVSEGRVEEGAMSKTILFRKIKEPQKRTCEINFHKYSNDFDLEVQAHYFGKYVPLQLPAEEEKLRWGQADFPAYVDEMIVKITDGSLNALGYSRRCKKDEMLGPVVFENGRY